jgi:selenoprotein W-related protein
MATVEIEYCVPCGFRDRAVDIQEAILSSLETELDEVRLIMGDHGIFRVSKDGLIVYDKEEEGELDADEIVRKIREQL